jgi:hypothetical protein
MKALLKIAIGIFAVIGVLSFVVLIVFFFPTKTETSKCNEQVIFDTTSITLKNGIEDYDKFRHLYFTNYTFQKSRTRFPVRGKPGKMWSMERWTPCNWQTLTPFFMDTITYGFRRPKYFTDSPYERSEEIFIKSDSASLRSVTKLTFKNEASKWYLIERLLD